MLRELRKNIAQSASNITPPDVFPWNRWIKTPKCEFRKIEEFHLAHYDTSLLVLNIVAGDISQFKHNIYGGKLSDKNFVDTITQPKCSRTFFGFATTKSEDVYVKFDSNFICYFSTIIAKDRFAIYICNEYNNQKEKVITLTPNLNHINHSIESEAISLFKTSFSETIIPPINVLLDSNIVNRVSDNLNINFNNNVNETLTLVVEFEFSIPETIDQMASFLPEIYNIDLLENETLIGNEDMQNDTTEYISLLNDITLTEEIKLISESVKKTFFLRNINIPEQPVPSHINVPKFITTVTESKIDVFETNISCLYDSSPEETIENLSIHDGKLFNKLNFLLQPNASITHLNDNKPETQLYAHQIKGVEFLTSNKFAILADQLGLGKAEQTIHSLKEILHKGAIKTALIICDESKIGYSNDINTKLPSGWSEQVTKVLSGISTTIIDGDIATRETKWQEPSIITISGFKTLFEDLSTNILDSSILEHFDCLIFDDADLLLNTSYEVEKLLINSQPYYTWLLTSQPLLKVKSDLYQMFAKVMVKSSETNHSLRRTEKDLGDYSDNDFPLLTRETCWIPLNNKQQLEYNKILTDGVESLINLMENGNPYRFQANVFALLHQLKRTTNCSSDSFIGSKTDFLGYQTSLIKDENEQVVIFTQYDKLGRQIIEDELNRKNIKFEKYLVGMSPQQYKEAIKRFETDKNITVFIYGVKAGRTALTIPDTRYIIHFDRWWNPTTYWNLEIPIETQANEFGSFNTKTIFSYLTPNSIDDKIDYLLSKKNIFNKKLFDTLSPQLFRDIITDEEWLTLLVNHVNELGLKLNSFDSDENFKVIDRLASEIDTRKYKLDYSELKSKTTKFFSLLGYKEIEVNNGTPGIVEFTGIYDTNQNIKFCAKSFFEAPVDPTMVTDFCESKLASDNIDRLFLIIPDEILPEQFNLPSNKISFVSKSSLVNYLKLFRL